MNINNILNVMRLTQNRKKIMNKLNILAWSRCSKKLFCGIHCFTIFICDSFFAPI